MISGNTNKSNLCAAVITYYPDPALPDRVASFTQYVREVVIVDNHSSDYIIEQLRKLSSDREIHLLLNPHNFGVATALNQAARWAIHKGYDWLLTLDQDSIFKPEMADAYFSCFHKLRDKAGIAIVSPQHLLHNEERKITGLPCDFCEKNTVMTSGNLISLAVFQEIGGFNDHLFIDEVDHDYCLRVKKNGFKILQFKNVMLSHKLGNVKLINRKGQIKKIHTHSPERWYYITRNHFYMWRKYKTDYPDVVYRSRRRLMKKFRNVLLYEENKIGKIYNMLRGFASFLMGKYGP